MKIDYDNLMRQAPGTVEVYMQHTVIAIDRQFGGGYANDHPELVASFIHDATIDFATGAIGGVLENISNSLKLMTTNN